MKSNNEPQQMITDTNVFICAYIIWNRKTQNEQTLFGKEIKLPHTTILIFSNKYFCSFWFHPPATTKVSCRFWFPPHKYFWSFWYLLFHIIYILFVRFSFSPQKCFSWVKLGVGSDFLHKIFIFDFDYYYRFNFIHIYINFQFPFVGLDCLFVFIAWDLGFEIWIWFICIEF